MISETGISTPDAPDQKPLLCILGPTASGKTALALALAQRLDGEVVSCDSMQVYRGLDIGTAKPTEEERRGIPHHMLDVADPWEDYSAARYAAEADRAIQDILDRGKRPIVAGGTGLYLRALVDGLHEVCSIGGSTHGFREKLLEEQGSEALHRALWAIDPETAARLPSGDTRRVLRALAVYDQTGRTLSQHHEDSRKRPPRYRILALGLYLDRVVLYRRIEVRVDDMMEAGLLDEATALRARLPSGCTAMQAIGYKELGLFLDGQCTETEAIAAIKQATRRYAKRQMTWFSRQVPMCWLGAGQGVPFDEALERITEWSV